MSQYATIISEMEDLTKANQELQVCNQAFQRICTQMTISEQRLIAENTLINAQAIVQSKLEELKAKKKASLEKAKQSN